jgi:hypothetical protein
MAWPFSSTGAPPVLGVTTSLSLPQTHAKSSVTRISQNEVVCSTTLNLSKKLRYIASTACFPITGGELIGRNMTSSVISVKSLAMSDPPRPLASPCLAPRSLAARDVLSHLSLALKSAPVGIRTSNLLIRSQMLYPVELRAQICFRLHFSRCCSTVYSL